MSAHAQSHSGYYEGNFHIYVIVLAVIIALWFIGDYAIGVVS